MKHSFKLPLLMSNVIKQQLSCYPIVTAAYKPYYVRVPYWTLCCDLCRKCSFDESHLLSLAKVSLLQSVPSCESQRGRQSWAAFSHNVCINEFVTTYSIEKLTFWKGVKFHWSPFSSLKNLEFGTWLEKLLYETFKGNMVVLVHVAEDLQTSFQHVMRYIHVGKLWEVWNAFRDGYS